MKLTSREKLMLIGLSVIAILALSYYFILNPQLERIEQLVIEKDNVQQQVDTVKRELGAIATLQADFAKREEQLMENSKRFYPEILQPQLIVLLDRLTSQTGLNVGSLSFTPVSVGAVDAAVQNAPLKHPLEGLVDSYRAMTGTASQGAVAPEGTADQTAATSGTAAQAAPEGTAQASPETAAAGTAGTAQAEKMTATLEYSKAGYNQVTAFIKALEALDRTIVIDNLSMASTEDGTLQGTMAVTFYALPKLHEQDTEYLAGATKTDTGRTARSNNF